MADPMARLLERVRARGVGATVRKAFADHVFRCSSSVIVEYRPGWGETGRAAIRPDWLSFVVVRDPADLPPLSDWMAWRRADFVGMLLDGKVAMLALQDGICVGCVWASLTDHHDVRAREFYPVGPREAYHYCWLIDPSMRRTNICMPFCRFVMNTLAGMGIERQFGVVDRINRASYLIQVRFGYRECGTRVRHYMMLGTRWTRMARYEGVLGTVTPKRVPA